MSIRTLTLIASLLATPVAFGQGNILLVIADDLGTDRVGAYAENPDPGHTPTIDRLAADGVLFRNAWVNPVCSATRARLFTGLQCFRTGVGGVINANQPDVGLQPGSVTIASVLGATYSTAILGKWHLADSSQPGDHALRVGGFDHHHGSLYNLGNGSLTDYFWWWKHTDGVSVLTNTYATTDSANEAIDAIRNLPEPWFVVLAFNAPHQPLHVPPLDLHTFGQVSDDVSMFKAMVEALDTELERVLREVHPEDTVIFVSDNGPYYNVITAPQDPRHGKATMFEGGLRVPLIVRGPDVARPGSECSGLVEITDLFETIAELAGLPADTEDSVSILPYLRDPDRPSLRAAIYAERFATTPSYDSWARAIRGARYKLIRVPSGDQFYDLDVDPFEQTDLLESGLDAGQQGEFDFLDGQLRRLYADL